MRCAKAIYVEKLLQAVKRANIRANEAGVAQW